jgi:hypothetical protein
MPSRLDSFSRLGCGLVLVTVVVSCLLLVLNGLIVTNVYQATQANLPDMLREHRWAQAIMFLGPIVMLVIQWWAYDVAVDWLWPRTRSASKG